MATRDDENIIAQLPLLVIMAVVLFSKKEEGRRSDLGNGEYLSVQAAAAVRYSQSFGRSLAAFL